MIINPRELVAGTIHLVSLPEIFLRVNEMIDNPHYSAADIGRVIGQDTGLTARLLKIVNSPFYLFPSKIDTVSRAVTIVGLHELRDLILATSIARIFAGIPNDIVDMDSFWRHSVGCALVAKGIAARRGEPHTERFFVAGLLHDVGSLLIYRKVPELAREALLRARHGGETLCKAEQAVIGCDHAAVGGELLRTWRLPKHLEEAVAFHHAPTLAGQYPLDAAIVHLANIIANAVLFGSSGDTHIAPFEPAAWDLTGLSPDIIEPIVIEAETQFSHTLEMIHPKEH